MPTRLSGSVGYSQNDSNLMRIRWHSEEFEFIMRKMRLPKEYAELFALGHSIFTHFGPFDLKSCCCTFSGHPRTNHIRLALTKPRTAYIFASSTEQLPCITAAASYDPATKITSMFYQCQSDSEREFELAKSFLSSASFTMDPLGPLVSVIGSITISMIRWSTEAFSTLYEIEGLTGHNALIKSDELSSQDVDISTMDFPWLVKALNSYSGTIELLDLLCEELTTSLVQILHILDRHREAVAFANHYRSGLQKLKDEAEYRNSSLKSLLLHYRSHQKRCSTQLTVVSSFLFSSLNPCFLETGSNYRAN
jgi:hypothetical protein